MTKISDLHKRWSADPGYRKAYDELADEFSKAAEEFGVGPEPTLYFGVFRSADDRFRWRASTPDGREVAQSTESYASADAALAAIDHFRSSVPGAAIDAAA